MLLLYQIIETIRRTEILRSLYQYPLQDELPSCFTHWNSTTAGYTSACDDQNPLAVVDAGCKLSNERVNNLRRLRDDDSCLHDGVRINV